MSNTIYTANLSFGKFRFAADLTQASAPIYLVDDDGELSSTQYQTADARHRERNALRLALQACGSEYYANPDSEESDEEQLDEIVETADIEEDEEG
jgi:hypothetical protein